MLLTVFHKQVHIAYVESQMAVIFLFSLQFLLILFSLIPFIVYFFVAWPLRGFSRSEVVYCSEPSVHSINTEHI